MLWKLCLGWFLVQNFAVFIYFSIKVYFGVDGVQVNFCDTVGLYAIYGCIFICNFVGAGIWECFNATEPGGIVQSWHRRIHPNGWGACSGK